MFRLLASVVGTIAAASDVTGTTSQAAPASIMDYFLSFGIFPIMIIAMYFILIRPQRKKEKEQKLMRSALEVGDEIITIGGIMGRIVSIKDDSIVIETGSDRDKIRIIKSAVQTVTTLHDSEESK